MRTTGYRDASTPEWTLVYQRSGAWRLLDMGAILVLLFLSFVVFGGACVGVMTALDAASPWFDRGGAALTALVGLGFGAAFLHSALQTGLDVAGRRSTAEGVIRQTPATYSRNRAGDLMVQIGDELHALAEGARSNMLRPGDRVRIERGFDCVHRVWRGSTRRHSGSC